MDNKLEIENIKKDVLIKLRTLVWLTSDLEEDCLRPTNEEGKLYISLYVLALKALGK